MMEDLKEAVEAGDVQATAEILLQLCLVWQAPGSCPGSCEICVDRIKRRLEGEPREH